MSVMGPARKATAERLAAELRKIAAIATPENAAAYERFAERAETGEFSDYAEMARNPVAANAPLFAPEPTNAD